MNSILDIRISEVKMQKSEGTHMAATAHRKAKASTTLNRKYVKRPARSTDMVVPVKRSPKIKHFNDTPLVNKKSQNSQPIPKATVHPVQKAAINRIQTRSIAMPQMKKLTAKELKEQAIKKALANAEKISNGKQSGKKAQKDDIMDDVKMHFGLGRVVLALSCAAVAVLAIVYFVNLNMPDISLRVAAMQTGIDATYPGYVPRGFSLSGITSEDGKIILNFKSSESDDVFSLIEENSSWDSSALLTSFVKSEYGEDFSTVREQGLTIYIKDGNASWVNGGIMYKINAVSGSLTKKQICSIATSL